LSTAIGIDYIFDMAERIERNGRDFYLTAARIATDASARDMLTNLGEMEARHESTFAAMRARVVGAGEVTSLDPQSDIVIYLKSLVRGRFFDISADPGSYFAGGESLKDILLTAIGLEKETIAFYVGLKEVVPTEQDELIVENIIREEMGHISTLGRQLQVYW
jgi:rubrerythrin